MGNIKVGAAIPPDVITGGVLGTAFAIMSGKGPAVALALAVPISILAEMVISGLFILELALTRNSTNTQRKATGTNCNGFTFSRD